MINIDKNIDFTLSEYTEKDHEGFVKCINTFYAGGYPYKNYLDKNTLIKLIANNEMIVTVAKTNDGTIIGTSAARKLNKVFGNSVLLLLRCVSKDYRGKGIGNKQEKFLFELIEKKFTNVQSLFADVMTHDAISQSTLLKNNFVLCGLRMCLYKNEIICPLIKFAKNTKMTQSIYCKKMTQKNVQLFAPDDKKQFIKNIYQKLNIPITFLDCESNNSKIEYLTEINNLHKCCEIHVTNAGILGVDELISATKKFIENGYTIVAYINMNQSGSKEIYKKLQDISFVFSGVKPLSSTGEYLVMSNINNCVKKLEDIKYPSTEENTIKNILRGFNDE